MDTATDVVVIGAGPAGLATAACLKRAGVAFELLERSDRVGVAWRNHYERLHLHTARRTSSLPFTRFSADLPTYPSRQDVVDYLDGYAREHGLEARFGVEVTRVARDGEGWRVEAGDAAWRAPHVVVATGLNRVAKTPTWPGREEFGGRVLHSREYRSGRDFRGQRVLVVGAGNSGAEIALDLCEQGATEPAICIRGPINVIPRDLFGVPAQVIGIATSFQPAALSDLTMKWISRAMFGDLERWGIRRRADGPLKQILEARSIPLIDVGTIARIKKGDLRVVPGIERFTKDGVRCVDGTTLTLDAVVLATGFATGLAAVLEDAGDALDAQGFPRGRTPRPGLHFVGFSNASTGLLREIAIEARAVARSIGSPPS